MGLPSVRLSDGSSIHLPELPASRAFSPAWAPRGARAHLMDLDRAQLVARSQERQLDASLTSYAQRRAVGVGKAQNAESRAQTPDGEDVRETTPAPSSPAADRGAPLKGGSEPARDPGKPPTPGAADPGDRTWERWRRDNSKTLGCGKLAGTALVAGGGGYLWGQQNPPPHYGAV